MEPYIILDGVSKSFRSVEVLKPLSIEFEEGLIHGIVGRNGSGKTVMMKLILGFLKPTQGTVTVGKKRVGKDVDFPQDVGAIIENVDFIPYLNAYDNLYNLAAIRHRITKEDVKQVLETVGLGDTGRKKVAKFSLGMRQRLAIAQAIMEKPKLIILDSHRVMKNPILIIGGEPMNGLDKRGVEEMRQIFLNLKAEGTTILLASHNMEDIRCLCDKVYEMDAGVLTPIDGVS